MMAKDREEGSVSKEPVAGGRAATRPGVLKEVDELVGGKIRDEARNGRRSVRGSGRRRAKELAGGKGATTS
jgi:hypothetical protein